MKKKVIAIIISILCLNIYNIRGLDKEKELYPEIRSIISLKEGPSIILEGKENKTFLEFENQDWAFEVIVAEERELINSLKEIYNLESFSKDTWKVYKESFDKYIYDFFGDDMKFQNNRFDTFLTICDNVERNKRIIMLLKQEKFDCDEMAMLLPYFTPYCVDYNEEILRKSPRAVFNVTNAVNYATKWANEYNMYEYRSWVGSDCTNFASQIAKAGGATKNPGNRDSIGSWYYDNHTDNGQSLTWIRADYFVRHWGVSFSSNSFSSFSKDITKGKFIAYDRNEDGKYDHVGFVTQADSSVGTYGGKVYKDFKVAQHTSNYHAWVSSSTNGWENVGGRYALLRNPY